MMISTTLWIATVLFLNPATGNIEASRIIPKDVYNNSIEDCATNLKSLAMSAENLGMKVQQFYCTPTPNSEIPPEHDIHKKAS